MFGKKIKSFTVHVLATVNMVVIIGLLLTGYSDRLYPPEHPWLANIGLAIPAFILANAAFMLFWLIVKVKWALLPIAGFLVAYAPIHTYSPINFKTDIPDGCIKVLTYNVAMLDSTIKDPETQKVRWPALDYIHETKADIVCLQEAWLNPDRIKMLQRDYAFWDSVITPRGGASLVVASRFPIVGKKQIFYPSSINGSGAFFLKIEGDTVVVINNHLESNSLTRAERGQIDDIVTGNANRDSMRDESRTLFRKITQAAVKRAPQVDIVADFVESMSDNPIILCGDLNSCPNSYVVYRLSQLLTDCYAETALGPGWSYNRNNIDVRIDHIMCSNHFQPFACQTDRKNAVSDHNPIVCWMKKLPK